LNSWGEGGTKLGRGENKMFGGGGKRNVWGEGGKHNV
jgi:hypothetical protein